MYLKTMLFKHECYWVFGLKSRWGGGWGRVVVYKRCRMNVFNRFVRERGGRQGCVVGVYKRFQMRI